MGWELAKAESRKHVKLKESPGSRLAFLISTLTVFDPPDSRSFRNFWMPVSKPEITPVIAPGVQLEAGSAAKEGEIHLFEPTASKNGADEEAQPK